MLEGLDGVDWSRLRHAYGSAEDLPGLILAMRAPDPDDRAEAMEELREELQELKKNIK